MLTFRIGVLINVQSVPYLGPKEITITWAMEIKTFSRPIRTLGQGTLFNMIIFLWSKIPGARCVMDVVAN
jgi:hypothetical protein